MNFQGRCKRWEYGESVCWVNACHTSYCSPSFILSTYLNLFFCKLLDNSKSGFLPDICIHIYFWEVMTEGIIFHNLCTLKNLGVCVILRCTTLNIVHHVAQPTSHEDNASSSSQGYCWTTPLHKIVLREASLWCHIYLRHSADIVKQSHVSSVQGSVLCLA